MTLQQIDWLMVLAIGLALIEIGLGLSMDTSSEEWRRICEARHVMRLPQEDRTRYYAKVKEKRGEAAFLELKAETARQWQQANGERQGGNGPPSD